MDGIGAGSELESEHRFIAPLPDLFAHDVAQSLVRFVVDLELSIARNPEQRRSSESHAVVKLVSIAANHFVQRRENRLSGSNSGFERNPLLQHRRDFDAGVGGRLFLLIVQQEG